MAEKFQYSVMWRPQQLTGRAPGDRPVDRTRLQQNIMPRCADYTGQLVAIANGAAAAKDILKAAKSTKRMLEQRVCCMSVAIICRCLVPPSRRPRRRPCLHHRILTTSCPAVAGYPTVADRHRRLYCHRHLPAGLSVMVGPCNIREVGGNTSPDRIKCDCTRVSHLFSTFSDVQYAAANGPRPLRRYYNLPSRFSGRHLALHIYPLILLL